ncbi:MAG: Holliday junction branch migration protein RuvA, partial [Ignavibacteria bacterium]|nr:Holliday junction branch migration protein RuvA [Ignavibacteria bacterium]
MISYLQGKLIQKNPTNILVDVNNVGYHLNISLQTFENLPNQNDIVKIHTILITREDAMLLYGFATEDEKKMFELLISVSGIGPKVAQSILSGIKTDELKEHIIQGNIFALTNIPGVGRKTAERLVVGLKDKLGKVEFTP